MIQSNPHFSALWNLNATTVEWLTVAGVLIGCMGVVLLGLKRLPYRGRQSRYRSHKTYPTGSRPLSPEKPPRSETSVAWQTGSQSMSDPLDQMVAISAVPFETIPLLNKEEALLLPVLERIVRKHGAGHRVMAQTSLGELIRPVEKPAPDGIRSAAHASINSKRLDFAVIDRFGYLVVAVEYQGSGHYRKESFMRDAVKREAIRKAGVAFMEVPAGFDASEVERQIVGIIAPARSDRPSMPTTVPGSRSGGTSM